MENRKFGSLTSSVNPQELSKTVEGAISLIGSLLALMGVVTTTDVNTIQGQVGTVVTVGFAFYSAIMVLYGTLRKVVVFVQQKYSI